VIHLDKGKTAKEEARELLLKEEASVRDRVREIQKNLSLMLRTLGDMATANSVFAHSRLPSMVLACCLLIFVTIYLMLFELTTISLNLKQLRCSSVIITAKVFLTLFEQSFLIVLAFVVELGLVHF